MRRRISRGLRAARRFAAVARDGGDGLARAARRRSRLARAWFTARLGLEGRDDADALGDAEAGRDAPSALERLYRQAVDDYRPRPYPGRITVFRLDDAPGMEADLGWGRLAGEVEVHMFRGDHLTVVTRDVHLLAGCLARCLERARRG